MVNEPLLDIELMANLSPSRESNGGGMDDGKC